MERPPFCLPGVLSFARPYLLGVVRMLKSCKYCGRVHDEKKICAGKKEAQSRRWNNRRRTKALAFRRTNEWTLKSRSVRERDGYMCLCCRAQMPGTTRRFETRDISVHHIIPVEEDYDKRLDDTNLISVCALHHEMCKRGDISRQQQQDLILRADGGRGALDEPCTTL